MFSRPSKLFPIAVPIIFQLLLVCAPAVSAAALKMRPATPSERMVLLAELGEDFVNGSDQDARPPNLVVAACDLNGDGFDDLIASQRSRCSNHSCDYEVLVSSAEGMKAVAAINSWADPELAPTSHAGMRGLIFHEKLTDDCNACSPPEPVLFIWSPLTYWADGGSAGTYIRGETLTTRTTMRPGPR